MVEPEVAGPRPGRRWVVSLAASEVAGRVHRLANTLAELKERVRTAVAGETGRAVGDAIRDLITAALTGRLSRTVYRTAGDGRDDDRDHWDEDDEYRRPSYDHRRYQDEDDSPARQSVRAATNWPTAFAAGAAAARWWACRRMSGWAAVGLGLLVGVATIAGGPVARAGLALVAAAADLVPALHPFREWGLQPLIH